MLGCGKPKLHHRDQAHAAGKRLRTAGEQMQRLVERFGSGVLKFLRDHVCCPSCSLSYFFGASSFQIFSGVSGMSTCFTPSGESASTTEFTTAGEQPIVPASPTPFTPRGFTGEGVSVWLDSIQGIICALGSA